jgi:phage-related protein
MSINFGLRKARFSYYYGMDLFNNGNIDDAVKEFEKMIKGLDEVNDRFSKEHYTTFFLKTNVNNLVEVLGLLGQKNMLRDMMELDPDNMKIYQAALD